MKFFKSILLLAVLIPSMALAQPQGLVNNQTPATGFTPGQCVTVTGNKVVGASCSGGGGPTGPAGGDLAGTYPNPTLASPLTNGSYTVQGATTTSPSWQSQISGDTTPRLAVGINAVDTPRISFGPGNAVRDLFLERAAAANLRLGTADAAAPVIQTLSLQGVAAGTSNTNGANFNILLSPSTGTGQGGGFVVSGTPAGSTGSTQNAQLQLFTVTTSQAIVGNGTRVALGIGTSSTGGFGIRNSATITGAVNGFGQRNDGTIQSDVTTAANMYSAQAAVVAAAFTLPNLRYYYATQGSFGAGATINNQYGFYADNTLTGATANYGFFSALNISGTARFAFYGSGTAPSHFGGAVDITGTIATSAPAGSSAGLWKLGALQTGAVVVDTTRSIFVDIGGVVYKLMVAQ